MIAKGIALAVILPLALAEFGPWCGWLAKVILPSAATLRYGSGERATIRCEEWTGNLEEIPGQLTKLAYSLAHLIAGCAIATYRKFKSARRIRITDQSFSRKLLRTYLVAEPDWRDQALCAQSDPDRFFPEKGGSTRQAKLVCQSCQVRVECLGYALQHDERFGVWGGLTEQERRKLKRLLV